MVTWLLQRDIFNEGNPETIAEIETAKGNEVLWLDYIPFGGMESIPVIRDLVADKKMRCTVAYGSIQLLKVLCSKLVNHYPLAWFEPNALKCSTYYSRWGAYVTQQRCVFTTWAELGRKSSYLYRLFSEDDCIFVRPNSNLKLFTGTIVPFEEFEKWYSQTTDCYSPEPDELVVVAKPLHILAESRFVIVDTQVVTGTLYKENGRLTEGSARRNVDVAAMDFAKKIANDKWGPASAYVADVALTMTARGPKYSLLEIGSVNCAGLYGCDLERFTTEIDRIAVREFKEMSG